MASHRLTYQSVHSLIFDAVVIGGATYWPEDSKKQATCPRKIVGRPIGTRYETKMEWNMLVGMVEILVDVSDGGPYN